MSDFCQSLRANDDETQSPRKFTLEGAEGSPLPCLCSFPLTRWMAHPLKNEPPRGRASRITAKPIDARRRLEDESRQLQALILIDAHRS